MNKVLGNLIGFSVMLVAFGPLFFLGGETNYGEYLPSEAWNHWWPWPYVITLATSVILAVLAYWLSMEVGRPKGHPATKEVVVGRAALGFVVIFLPLWSWAIVHGIVKRAIDGPVLAQLSMPAHFKAYYQESSGRRGSTRAWVVIETEAFGSMRISTRKMKDADLPNAGDEVLLTGHRTWVGDTYDHVRL